MSLSEASSRSSSVAMTGRRPTNSGIRPYLSRSSGSTSRKISPCFLSSGAMTLAPKPIEPGRLRAEIIFSRPVKAPPQTNRMLVVSTCMNSCCGCLRPPCGGALAGHVAGDRGIVGLARYLVDLVDVDDAALGALDVVFGGLQQLENNVLDV